ncbi:MAG TPA: exonuclease domain-containing protein [Rhabdochlamydiaceae bacterium]
MLNKELFVCLDCETTGLDFEKDQIIEIALARFNFDQVLDSFETLIDPQMLIPEASTAIHHITDLMVQGKPTIASLLPKIMEFVGKNIIVGHGIMTDITFLSNAAKRHNVPSRLSSHPFIDTLRLARLYGESPTNSLEMLRKHFNIEDEGAHRAMNDVIVNVEVFKYLSRHFKTTEQMIERLKSPILLRAMPLGKFKGRPFSEISLEYLLWASHQKFDQDLLFSIKMELKKRKRGSQFGQSTSPFANL